MIYFSTFQMVNSNDVDSSVVEEMMDQLRKDNNIAIDNLERKRQNQMADLEVRCITLILVEILFR